ncbi:MAG: nucleotidyltransferase domain-containing protein [Burkholderiales bacterium]
MFREQPAPRRRGRPRSAAPLSAAERARRYRARLLEKGIRARSILTLDAVSQAVRFSPESLLTPAEREVLRRFCSGLRKLPTLPRRVAVFGSRVRGNSDASSDLDVAVFVDRQDEVPAARHALGGIAAAACGDYQAGTYRILLRPVVLRRGARGSLAEAVRAEQETVWTRPR